MNIEEVKLIYAFGASNRYREKFIRLLPDHHVKIVVDVRPFVSSRFEHFCRGKSEELLLKAGINYIHMG